MGAFSAFSGEDMHAPMVVDVYACLAEGGESERWRKKIDGDRCRKRQEKVAMRG